ncbi:MAG: PEP/pyruvate-binding domain-containing protein [Desulfobacterales bacterium]
MNTTMTNVRPLDTTDDGLEVLGGKGRSLARMINAGFAVPGGFHLTTAAYRGFVADNDLQAKIVAQAKPEVREGRASFETASSTIQALIGEHELSPDLVTELREAYAALDGDDPAVAVRSSANAEDLPGLSFAGQQETYLNVCGADALVAAVRNCWASLWTTQAISYRHQNGIDQDSVAMAVVVQIMVPADVAGILFTANPATGERSEMIINASFGLGEAVVGGQVTPDTYIVDRGSMTVKETMIGPKEQKIVSDGNQGTRLEDVSEEERAQSSLSDALLSELATLSARVEEHFDGMPQDIEWAIVDGKVSLLQSRPITNLPPQPIEVEWEPPEGIKGLVRRQLIENVPDPTFPLFDELYLHKGLAGKKPGGRSGFTTLHGFAFQIAGFSQQKTDEQFFRELKEAREKAAQTPEVKAQEAHDLQLFLDQLSEVERADFQVMADALDTDNIAHAVTMPESDNPTYTAFHKTLTNDRQHKDWRERAVPELEAATEKWRQVDLKTASDEQLMTGIRELAAAEGWYWSSNGGHTFGVAKSTDDQLQCFLRETLPDHNFTSGQFLSGFKSRIMQANDDLYDVCKMIRANDSLYETVVTIPAKRLMGVLETHPDSGPVLKALDTYLQTYGHQGYSLDFGEPTQIEDPSVLFVSLKAMVQNKNYNPKQHEEQARAKREKAMQEITALLDGLQYWQLRYRLWFTGKYYPIREESCFVLGTAWPVLRPMASELGRRLVDVGTLADPEDIYFLWTAEIEPALEARKEGKAVPEYIQLTAERHELREARRRLHPPGTIPPEIRENPGVKFKETQFVNDESSDTLRGIPVSPGTITGPASVIHNADEFDQMQPGSILVCPMTSPAWTQLFAHASGLVTDIGGILGHGSIVAREYGIPAVVGTGTITVRVKSGQILEVDGDAGTVKILEEG